MYLESYHGNLETYIESVRKDDSFYKNWNAFPNLCFQLVDAVTWLHHHCVISLGGRLNPRNVFIKGMDSQRLLEARYLKVFVPERLNPFNNLDHKFAEAWTRPDWSDPFQKDVASMAMIMYFIQTCGHHPYQVKDRQSRANNYLTIRKNVLTSPENLYFFIIEGVKCFCEPAEVKCKAVIGCKYRHWVNNFLAKDVIREILNCSRHKRDELKSTQWIKHPFFWTNQKIVYFIQRACAYLEGIRSPHKVLDALKQKINTDIENVADVQNELLKSFPNMMAFCQESKYGKKYDERNLFRKKAELLKWIRDKVFL